MSKAKLLSTTAAALLLTVGVASAQDMKKNASPEPAPAAQQRAPAEKVAPNMHAGDRKATPETTGQAPKMAEPDKAQTLDKGNKTAEPKAGAKGSTAAEQKTQMKSGGEQPTTAKSNTTESSKQTTGQGAAAGAAKLSTEQRTKITTIIREHRTPSVHLSVSVSVGTRIPTSVHLYPIPVEVISIYPEWRGYDYVMVGDQIVVIDPRSHEIVAVLEA
jgi:type IV secretory pathway VirB10-like protein